MVDLCKLILFIYYFFKLKNYKKFTVSYFMKSKIEFVVLNYNLKISNKINC